LPVTEAAPSTNIDGAAKADLTIFCKGLLLRCHGSLFAVRILKAGYMATPMIEEKAPPIALRSTRNNRQVASRVSRPSWHSKPTALLTWDHEPGLSPASLDFGAHVMLIQVVRCSQSSRDNGLKESEFE